MTYDEYIAETTNNCMTVLSECHFGELEEIDHLTSLKGSAAANIKGALFDSRFLADFNGHGLNMQTVMAYGPDAVDVIIRCLSLKYISVVELAEKEREKRLGKEKDTRRNSTVRV